MKANKDNPSVDQLNFKATEELEEALQQNKERNEIRMIFVGEQQSGNYVLEKYFDRDINESKPVFKYKKNEINGRVADLTVYGPENNTEAFS